MHVNRERFTKTELAFSLILFGSIIYETFKSPEFINSHIFTLIYFLAVLGYIVGAIVRLLVLNFTKKSKVNKVEDERDKFIASKSYRNSYITFFVLINVIIIYFIFYNNILQPAFFFNLLLGTLFISHIVLTATRVFYYKRGIQ